MDLIMNGQAHGTVASRLLASGFDPGVLRPYIDKKNRGIVTVNAGGDRIVRPVANALLRSDEWKQIDTAVTTAARQRLRLISDLRSSGLTYNVPNGMGTTVLESERMGDITGATISMDPARKSEGDRPEFDLINLPLPIIHKDFFFNLRQIAVSRARGGGIDTTTAELASRKVVEEAEKLALGTAGTYSYGGGTVYGLTNFPERLTYTLTSPEASAWTPQTLVQEILGMRQASTDNNYHGPWVAYISPAWSEYLDDDYNAQYGGETLRTRLRKIDGISDIRTLDYLTGYQIILVQMTSDVVRLVNGMDLTTVQWETDGGMRVHFKVMAIWVPQIRADYEDQTGLVHGNVA